MISVIKIFGLKRALIGSVFLAIAITFFVTSLLYYGVFGEVMFVEVGISMIIPVVIIVLLVPKLMNLYAQVNSEKEKNKIIIDYDEITGLYNKKIFLSHLRREINSAKRYKSSLTVMLIEISNFKLIEQERGRHISNYVIKEISSHVTQNFRKSDILARYNENSFAAILPHTNIEESKTAKNKIKLVLEQKPIYFKDEIEIKTQIKMQSIKDIESETEDSLLNRLEA